MKTLKVKPTTREKYDKFRLLVRKQGWYDGGRYGWGLTEEEAKILDSLKDDPDLIILRIPPNEIEKNEAIEPNVVISDKFKYITTVADQHLFLEFQKPYLPNFKIIPLKS